MPATLTRFIFAADGTLQQIVNLDDDAHLQNYKIPQGSVFIDAQRVAYRTNISLRDNLVLAQSVSAQTNPVLASAIQQNIDKIDATATPVPTTPDPIDVGLG